MSNRAHKTKMSSSKRGRRYRGWITAEELAAEQGVRADAMDVDEDGQPFLRHTSQLFSTSVRDVFRRQKAAGRSGGAHGSRHDGALADEVEQGDSLWHESDQGKRSGAARSRKRPVPDNFTAEQTEAKLDRRVRSGRSAIELAGQGKKGREALIGRVKASLLLSVVPENVPCRSDQEAHIMLQINERIRAGASELLYVSGQPGTGKTLTVHRVMAQVLRLRDAGSLPPFKLVSINALNDLPTPQTLFERLYADVTGNRLTPGKAQKALEAWYTADEKPAPHYVVVLLDEMDSLVAGQQAARASSVVLHTLLEWMSRPRSRLLIIGISNTIDLLERLDSKTLSRGGMAVSKVLFRPYSWLDIAQILESRLQSAQAADDGVFDKQALELCAKKTANDKGDVRRALQVCLRAVEKLEERLVSDETTRITVSAMAECLKDLRTGSFAAALGNLSLCEKLFMWGLARECAVTGDSSAIFAAIEMRLSTELAQIYHATMFSCPGRHVWEQVRDALLSSHLLLQNGLALSCPKEFQPEDITFYMKKSLRSDDVLKHLPTVGTSYD